MWPSSLLQVLLAGRDDLPWWHADSGRDEPPAERDPGAWAPASARQGRRRPRWRAASGYGAAFVALFAVAVTSLLLLAPAPIDDGGPAQHQVSEERHERIRGALLGLGAEEVTSRASDGVLYVEYRLPNQTAHTPAVWQVMALEAVGPLVPADVSLVLVQHAADGSDDDSTSILSLTADDLEGNRQNASDDAFADTTGTDAATGTGDEGAGDAAPDGTVEDDARVTDPEARVVEEPLADARE